MITEFKGKYHWLSNFAPCKIEIANMVFPSVEHAYMSCKSDDLEWKLKCASPQYTAGEIKKMSKNLQLIQDWEKVKTATMMACLWQKFHQEPYKTLLIETGDIHIQEGNYWGDKFWGVCLKSNEGQNRLGKLIMDIRETLKNKNYGN